MVNKEIKDLMGSLKSLILNVDKDQANKIISKHFHAMKEDFIALEAPSLVKRSDKDRMSLSKSMDELIEGVRYLSDSPLTHADLYDSVKYYVGRVTDQLTRLHEAGKVGATECNLYIDDLSQLFSGRSKAVAPVADICSKLKQLKLKLGRFK
jgi:hypothetical protein